jgi:hypothetical protein
MSTRTRVEQLVQPEQAKRGLRLLARIGFAASAVIHLLLGCLAIPVAFHQGGESDQSGAIAQVGRLPGGAVLLWVMTVGLFALAAWLLLEAVLGIGSGSAKRWMRTVVSATKVGDPQRRVVGALGIVGYVAKGIAVGVVGVLVVVAAVTLDPGQSTGLDGALRALSGLPSGTVLLLAVGVGLMAFGVYTFARARYARF